MQRLIRRLPLLAILLGCCLACGSAFAQSDAGETVPRESAELAEQAQRTAAARLGQVRASADAVGDILELGLSNDEVSDLLRQARARAPNPAAVRDRVTQRERDLVLARLDRIQLLESQRLGEGDAAQLATELEAVEAYIAAAESALEVEKQLADAAAALVGKLDEELLWIGSAPAIDSSWPMAVASGVRWAIDPSGWLDVGKAALRGLRRAPAASVLWTLFVGALLFGRLFLTRQLDALASRVGRFATDSFLLTLRALLITVLLSLPGPLSLAGPGLLLILGGTGFAEAVGHGLLGAGATWLLLGWFHAVCRSRGLAEVHFSWDEQARRTLRLNLKWLMAVEVPAAFVTQLGEFSGEDVFRQGLGRAGFLVGSVALTLFVARVFRPANGVFGRLMNRDGWAWRLRRLWYGLLVALPAVMTLAAAGGYYYTATEVQGRFFLTGLVALLGVVVYSLFTRGLLVARRRLAVQQARQRLAEQREARLKQQADPMASSITTMSGDATPDIEPQTVDVEAASGQTLTLLRTLIGTGVAVALWAVWADVLPALSVLDRVELAAATIDGEGNTIVPAVTLWSLTLAAFVLVLTYIAARNLPAVLELVVLQRFPIDAGTRYAAVTLLRYVVTAIGLVVASNLIGIDWGKAQWVVAALGVGLGFGLQEIVANFVSGLIILFERPVRVGDVVTVGDVSGTVSRLQIRATTLTDFDNKEVLVPNKSFITDRVVNWTLSSPVTRLLIPVGVAYGSDTAKTQQLVLEAVRSVPNILTEPAPSVLFVGFGDSSLNFEIRAFVGELGHRLPAIHDLHTAIDHNLREAGIEIPFPQRDVHLKRA